MKESDLQAVRGFARALDRNDFAGAATYLAPRCVYSGPYEGQEVSGAGKVVAYLRGLKEWAGTTAVSSESSIADAGAAAQIEFVHRLKYGLRDHVVQWKWSVEVEDERIVRIEHPPRPPRPEPASKETREDPEDACDAGPEEVAEDPFERYRGMEQEEEPG